MIIKRTVIDNSIIKELQDKYPAIANNNDVVYKLGLNYLTFEPEFITSPLLRKLIREQGYGVLVLIHYLRSKMCVDGWKVRVDDFYLYDLLEECAYKFFLQPDTMRNIYQSLIDNHIFYEVCDTSCIEGVWLTCPQQIYNFEMANNQRQKDRERQQKKRSKAKKKENESVQQATDTEYSREADYPNNEDYYNIPYIPQMEEDNIEFYRNEFDGF